MKILIADKMSKSALSALEKLGHAVVSNPDLKAEDLPAAIGDAEVLIVRSTKVIAATIEAGKNLSLIIRAGAGVNNIPIAKCTEKGVVVFNTPGANANAVVGSSASPGSVRLLPDAGAVMLTRPVVTSASESTASPSPVFCVVNAVPSGFTNSMT